MSGVSLFTPATTGTVNVVVSATSQRVAFGFADSSMPRQVRVKNADTANFAFVNFGTSTVTASSSTSTPIGPGETAGFSIGPGVTHAAAISASGATVYFTPGQGQ